MVRRNMRGEEEHTEMGLIRLIVDSVMDTIILCTTRYRVTVDGKRRTGSTKDLSPTI